MERETRQQAPALQGREAWQRSTEIYEEAESAWQLGDRDAGMDLVNQALRIWPQNPMALVLRSTFRAELGNKRQALDDIEAAILLYETAVSRGIAEPNNPELVRVKALRDRLRMQRRYRRYYR